MNKESGGMWMLPKDPFILLSYVNTKLRDGDLDLNDLCEELGIAREELEQKLAGIGYIYDGRLNCFK